MVNFLLVTEYSLRQILKKMCKEKVESVDQRVMFKPLTKWIFNYLLKVNKYNKNNRKSIYSNGPKSVGVEMFSWHLVDQWLVLRWA